MTLSCCWHDLLYCDAFAVHQVMKGGIAKDISFIEAEQALLQCEGSVQGTSRCSPLA